METSNILIILLFILPGILAEKISYFIDYPSKKTQSDFSEMIRGILLSLPIVFIGGVIHSLYYKLNSLESFISSLNNLKILFTFTGIIMLAAIITGIIFGLSSNLNRNIVNKMRKWINKMPSDDRSCWQKFLIDENKARYLEIIKNGNSYKGFAKCYSLSTEDAAIVLETDIVLYQNQDYNPDELFTDVIGIYIDLEKDVVIKDYDMSKYDIWCEEKILRNQNTTED